MISAKVVLFDLGNTLFYDNSASWPGVYKRAEAALWRILTAAGVRIAPSELYGGQGTLLTYYYALRGEGLVEPGAFNVLKELLAGRGEVQPDSTVEQALRAMYAVTQRNWRLEGDARRTVRTLLHRHFRLGAVSNGSDDRNALELLDAARLRDSFEIIITSAAHGRRKPDASIFRAALDHFQVPAARAVMIGDSYQADILGAHAVGMHAIWITRRARPLPPAAQILPEATVRTLRELPALLIQPSAGEQ